MARTFYDSLALNEDIELDLSMLEASGSLLHDESTNHSTATTQASIGSPAWKQTSPGIYGVGLNVAYPALDMKQFIDIPAADCTNLDFTTTDYSLAVWFYYSDSGAIDQLMMSKYIVDGCGWEAYLSEIGTLHYLTVRHHHPLGATTRTGFYSLGWAYAGWHLFSCSRIGTTGYHYRDGEAISTVSDTLIDPASNAACDFRFGCRYSEDDDWFKGMFHRPRAWSRALSVDEHRLLYRLGYP